MIVDTMSYEEIVNAYKKDTPEVQRKCCSIIRENLSSYKRAIFSRSRPGSIFFRPVNFKSSSCNDYSMQAFAYDKASFKKSGLRYYSFLYFLNKAGIHVVIDSACNFVSEEFFSIFIPHFFERYRTRFLMDESLGMWETIYSYFKANQGGTFMPIPSEKYKNSFYCAVNDGVALGTNINDEIVLVKTFITYEMLKGEQIEIGDDLGQALCVFMDGHKQLGFI